MTDETRTRIEAVILDSFANDFEPAPRDVAEALVDEDVAAGLYAGCSDELEMCFMEYERAASAVLGQEV